MSERNTSISSPRLSPREADCAAQRQSTGTKAERGDNLQTPVQELSVTVHKTSGKRYGPTNISDKASAVLGDVTHHNYFYGGKVPYLAGLQVYQEGDVIDPDTISDYDYRYAHWLRSEQRLEHTCEWMFERPAYKKWLNSTGPPILIVSGTVGSGKSITAGAVIDKLTPPQQHDTQLVISYFVDHLRHQPTTCIEILRALVKQICHLHKVSNEEISNDLDPSLKVIFPSAQSRPSAKAITHLLSQCMLRIKLCILVIDGIDALPEREVNEFLDSLHELFSSSKSKEFPHKLIVFCRHSLGRGVRLESIPSSAHLEIGLKNIQQDLFTFVDHEVDLRQRRRPITDNVHLIEETKRVLKQHCGKMFLWIRLQISSLWDPGLINCDDDIKQQLSSLPEGLDEIYTRCLRRIEDTYSKSSREIACKLFKWIACANESLTQLQAREAVSITPQNIPLRRSQMLNTPAEDHCANLVTLNETSRKVVFPHPSVRDFLRDPLKVPPDLHHYLLSAETDELWCGEICLAYSQYLQSQKQVVLYKTARIQDNIPTVLIRDVPGAWLPSLFRKPRPHPVFQMPLPISMYRGGDLQESCLHDYMRRHWLSHNRQIRPTATNYTTFAKLCLGQDPQLQPWATERVTGLEHYQKLFEFAVMTNHVPLFDVAADFLEHGKASHLAQIFSKGCPGTDSSWLHICAALGHKELTGVMLRRCRMTTVAHGKSAAVLALEHRNFHLFGFLIPISLPGPVWTLSGDGKSGICQENLLRACAMYGNANTMRVLLSRLYKPLSREHLSDALLHAWKHNLPEVSDMIITAGASLEYLYLIEQDKEYYMSQFYLDTLIVSPLLAASRLGNHRVWHTVWTAKVKACASRAGFDNILQLLLLKTRSTAALDESSAFEVLGLLSQSPNVPYLWEMFGDTLTWLDIIVQHIRDASRLRLHAWNSILRSLLTAMHFHGDVSAVHAHPMSWLERLPDDILVHLLKDNLIQMKFLLEPAVIEKLAQRWSSRGLEAWLGSLGLEQTLCLRQSDDTASRVCLSAGLEQLMNCHSQSRSDSSCVNYSALLYTLRYEAMNEGRLQVADFLHAMNLPDMFSVWDLARRQASSSADLGEFQFPWNENTSPLPFPPTLTWLRLYSLKGGNKAGKGTLQNTWHEKWRTGIDDNFALNYPAGYDLIGNKADGVFRSLTITSAAIGQTVRSCIIEALYRWNHRLRRKHRRYQKRILPLSGAERWYIEAYVVIRQSHYPQDSTAHVI